MAQLALADTLVWLDDTKPSNTASYTNRVQIKLSDETKWLTIPIAKKSIQGNLSEITSSEFNWQERHLSVIQRSFHNAPHKEHVIQLCKEVFHNNGLFETIVKSSETLAREFGVMPKNVFRASTFNLESVGSERILEISRILGATKYISGHGGFNYLDHNSFVNHGIDVEYLKYSLKPWKQIGSSFTPFVTSLDILASNSPQNLKNYLIPMTTNWKTGKPRIENVLEVSE